MSRCVSEGLPLALSMGEPSGVGPQLTLRAWLATASKGGAPRFFVVAPPSVLREAATLIHVDVPLHIIDEPARTAQVFPEALPVVPIADIGAVRWGCPQISQQKAVIDSLEQACAYVRQGMARAIVTNPDS